MALYEDSHYIQSPRSVDGGGRLVHTKEDILDILNFYEYLQSGRIWITQKMGPKPHYAIHSSHGTTSSSNSILEGWRLHQDMFREYRVIKGYKRVDP